MARTVRTTAPADYLPRRPGQGKKIKRTQAKQERQAARLELRVQR